MTSRNRLIISAAVIGMVLPIMLLALRTPTMRLSDKEQAIFERIEKLPHGDQLERLKVLTELHELTGPQSGPSGIEPLSIRTQFAESVVLDALLDILRGEDASERLAAMSILQSLLQQELIAQPLARDELSETLLGIFEDPESVVEERLGALSCLRHSGSHDTATVDALMLALVRETDPSVHRSISIILSSASESDPTVKSRLDSLALDDDPQVRRSVVSTLEFLDKPTDSQIDAVIEGLRSRNASTRSDSLNALMSPGIFKRTTSEDRDAVRRIILDSTETVGNRVTAVKVMGRMAQSGEFEADLHAVTSVAGDSRQPREIREEAIFSIPLASNYSLDRLAELENLAATSENEDLVAAAVWAIKVINDRHQLRLRAVGRAN